jgi:hypothetical protein
MVHIAPLVHRPQSDQNQTTAVPKLLHHTSTWFIQPPLETAKDIANFCIKTSQLLMIEIRLQRDSKNSNSSTNISWFPNCRACILELNPTANKTNSAWNQLGHTL